LTLPDIPLLRRSALRSAGGWTFDPYTFITRGPRDITRERELDLERNFAAQQASLHEDHHWLQWVGTSVGLFLTTVRFSQEQSAGLLSRLPDGLRRSLYDERAQGVQAPIVRLGPDGAILEASDRGNQELGSLLQGWYDHLLTYRLFLNSDCVDQAPWDVAAGLAETLCDIESTLHLIGVTNGYDYATLRRRLAFSDLAGRVGSGANRLTTRLILEAAATVDELLGASAVTRMFPEAGKGLGVEIVSRLRSGSYGVALRRFGTMVHDDPDAAFDDLVTFGVVCDIALNPPLPPCTSAAVMPTSWFDLYPPIRFVRACIALRRLRRKLGMEGTHADCLALQEDVCELAGITMADDLAPHLDGYQRVNWSAQIRSSSSAMPEDYGYLDFVFWCGARARELRKTDLRLLTTPALRITAGDPAAMELRIETGGDGWYHAPVWALGDAFGFSHPMTSAFGTWLVTKAAAGACVDDWMAGRGRLDLSWLPQRLLDSRDEVWDATLSVLLGVRQ
jgi:hypothetical protein